MTATDANVCGGDIDTMQQLFSEDLKQIQIEILDVVHAFCRAHGIRYWLDSGTMIGAIRHKGYIPWDDDIDVGMLRPDFDRFLTEFNKENDRYYVICNDIDHSCPYPYAKVMDRRTVLYEPDENGPKQCVNIDIFVYDNAPADDHACNHMYNMRDIYRSMNLLQNRMIGGEGIVKHIITICGYHILRHFPTACFATRVANNSKRYADQETGYVGNFTAFTRIKEPIHVFDSFVEVPFEGKMYDVPAGYDEWLRNFYGDYMQLPPEEKRVTHHLFTAYRLDDDDNTN